MGSWYGSVTKEACTYYTTLKLDGLLPKPQRPREAVREVVDSVEAEFLVSELHNLHNPATSSAPALLGFCPL